MKNRRSLFLKQFMKSLEEPWIGEQNQDTVNELNERSARIFLALGGFISVVYFFIETFLRKDRRLFLSALPFLYLAAASAVFCWMMPDRRKKATRIVYVLEAPLLLFSIYVGTSVTRSDAAFSFFPLIIGLPLIILDRPKTLFRFVGSMFGVFLISAWMFKPKEILMTDLLHAALSLVFAISLDAFVLSSRIDLLKASVMFRQESEHDPLTGIYNRRGADRIREYLSDRRAGMFLEIDVDHFKGLNDQFGHDTGDLALEKVSGVLRNSFRSTDIVMRTGGDEFVVYAPGIWSRARAEEKLAAMEQEVQKISVSSVPSGLVTISAGCVINAGSYLNFDDLFRAGDQMLYEAKRKGRNRWCIKASDSAF